MTTSPRIAASSLAAFGALVLFVGCHRGGGGQPPAPEGSPAAPSGLRHTPEGSIRTLLEWTDNSNDEDGFVLRYRHFDEEWVETQLPADTTSHLDGPQPYNTRVTYSVCAFNGYGRSWWSNEVVFQTPDPPRSTTPNCALLVDPGTTSAPVSSPTERSASSPCVWLCATDRPRVLDRTLGFGSSRSEVLRDPNDGFTLSVGGRRTTRQGLTQYLLQLSVVDIDMPVGTSGDLCLMLHDPAKGDVPSVLARAGFTGRPVVHALPPGTAFPVRPGQLYPVTATVDAERGTWSVTVFNIPLTRDVPLDAIVLVPSVHAGR